MTFSEFENRLASLTDKVFLFKGNEPFLFIKAKSLIAEKFDIADIDIKTFDGENFYSETLTNALFQHSFFCDKSIVILEKLENLTDKDKKYLAKLIEDKKFDNYLLLIDTYNNGIFNFLEKNCLTIETNKLTSYMLLDMIQRKLNANGKNITKDGADALLSYTNNSLAIIENEIQKLIFIDEYKITAEEISKYCNKNLEFEIFELTNCLSSKKTDKALLILKQLMLSSDNVFGLISSCFRRMFYVSISNMPANELARIFKIKEYAITKSKEQAKNFGAKKLKAINDLLLDVDYRTKNSLMSVENAMYYLVFNIVS